jgi:hypothetical protein
VSVINADLDGPSARHGKWSRYRNFAVLGASLPAEDPTFPIFGTYRIDSNNPIVVRLLDFSRHRSRHLQLQTRQIQGGSIAVFDHEHGIVEAGQSLNWFRYEDSGRRQIRIPGECEQYFGPKVN